MQIYDVSNPSAPTLVSTIATGTNPRKIYVQGKYAYVANYGSSSLQIYDVSNPYAPVSINILATNTGPWGLWVQGRYAYVGIYGTGAPGNGTTMQVVDVSNPSKAVIVGTATGLGSGVRGVYVQGRYAYITNYAVAGTMQVVDVKNPASPALVAGSTLSVGNAPAYIWVQGNYAYVANVDFNSVGASEIVAVNITNPAALSLAGSMKTADIPAAIYVQGRYLYSADEGDNKLEVFDLGGLYVQQLSAGGAELGTLTVDANANFGNDINTAGGLTVGQNATVSGTVSIAQDLTVGGGGLTGAGAVNISSATATNLITNPGFEEDGDAAAPTGWTAVGSPTSFLTDKLSSHDGAEAGKVVTTSTIDQGAKYAYAFTPNTTYTFSVWAAGDTAWTNFEIGSIVNGASSSCLTAQTLPVIVTSPFQQYSCTFTTGGTISAGDGIYVRNHNAGVHTIYIDTAVLQVANTAGLVNLINNPSFENGNTNGWVTKPEAGGTGNTIASSTDMAYFGNRSMKLATGTIAGQGAKYMAPLQPGTQYSMSFWARKDSSSAATFNVGRSDTFYNNAGVGTVTQAGATVTGTGAGLAYNTNVAVGDTLIWADGTTETVTGSITANTFTVSSFFTQASGQTYEITKDTADCLSGQTFDTSWRQFNCTFTTTASATFSWKPYVYIKQTDTTSDFVYIDGVTLVQASTGLSFTPTSSNLQVSAATNTITLNNGATTNDLQPWQTSTNAVPFPRRHAGAVTANGYVYYLGGLTGAATPVPVNAVNFAKLNADGSTSSWICQGTAVVTSCGLAGSAPRNTNSLPAAVYAPAVAYANGYIYVVGGCTDSSSTAACTTRTNTVYYAQVNKDGTTGAWQTSANTAYTAGYTGAAVLNGSLYEYGGTNGGAALNTQQSAKLGADGSIGAWINAGTLVNAVFGMSSVVANGNIYMIGGCTDSSVFTCTNPTNAVQEYSYSFATGTYSNSSAGNNLPEATGLEGSVVLNGNLYVIGGRANLTGSVATVNNVYYARINADGSLGAWNVNSNSLPAVRQGASIVAANSYVYNLGGYDGTNVQGSAYYTSGARTLVAGGLDLVGLNGLTASDPNGGTLTAGDTSILGNLNVANLASLNGGLSVNGPVGIFSSGTGTTAINVTDTTTGINLLNVKNLNTNFGGAATSGAFISRNSYFGEEFNSTYLTAPVTITGTAGTVTCSWDRGDMFGGRVGAAPTACSATANTSSGVGELNFSATLGAVTAGDSCAPSHIAGVNGVERIQANSTVTASNSAACQETLAAAAGTSSNIYATANLPVITMKVKPSTLASGNNNRRVWAGIARVDTAALGMPTDGIFFSNCSTYSTASGSISGCSNTTWYGIIASGSASQGVVQCTGTMSTTQFAYLRIEVRSTGAGTGEVHFYADVDTSNGVQETECTTVISGATTGLTLSAQGMTPVMAAVIADQVATNVALDIDFFRGWQDDNAPSSDTSSTDTTVTTPTTPDGTPLETAPPISPDSADPAIAGSFFNFNANTSDDTVFDHNVFVHGTLYADKIVANQIEGLSVFTDQLASLQQKLAGDQASIGASADPNTAVLGTSTVQSAITALNLSDGLTVGGDANFHGNAIFYKLVTFVEKTVFNNDISLGSHLITTGDGVTVTAEAGAGDTSASATVDGNDISGQVTLNVGDNSATGKIMSLYFKKPLIPPRAVLRRRQRPGRHLHYLGSVIPTAPLTNPPPTRPADRHRLAVQLLGSTIKEAWYGCEKKTFKNHQRGQN